MGHALANANGDPSYPIEDADDLRRAIKAVGRGSRSSERIRQHIMKRGKALGLVSMIPNSWASDGSLTAGRSSLIANDTDELLSEFWRMSLGGGNSTPTRRQVRLAVNDSSRLLRELHAR
jgi:hypothetical protein